uniref:vWA domain-containing protein n=1 Tax=Paractinoplanes polyasparticus TaxID=2856853 RepID=UPI001C84261A|nr:vWA domain-containing protein [Actinoplanes polyasparticus]
MIAFRTRTLATGVAAAGLFAVMVPLPAQAAPGVGEPKPVDVVVLVDESGSLRPEGVDAEREAAKIITQSEFSAASRLAVVGFASDNGQGQGPVDVVCPMAAANTGPAREKFATCVDRIKIREPGRDDDTDFPSAVRQGLQMLRGGAEDRPKIMFLLTDGQLDVSDSPRWGGVADLRNRAAQAELDTLLARARTEKVQVWPLGFGAQVDRAKLAAFAAAGGQQLCNTGARRPEATVVSAPADVVAALQAAFAAARCAALSGESKAELPTGETTELEVDVPAIATYGSLTVLKGDPTVEVDYHDPQGATVPKNGTAGASTFEASGERSAVEVLRIKNPAPGTWKIGLRSSPRTPDQRVSARVLWQGVVQASVVVDPPQPTSGQQVTASVDIMTPTGAIDAASLAGLTVSVEMSGEGIKPATVPVRDDGRDGDREAGDGQFTGRVTVPASASGSLSFTGVVSGDGIVTDKRPATTSVQSSGASLYASVQAPSGERVSPGGSVEGVVAFANTLGRAVDVRLVPANLDDGTLVTIQPATMRVSVGNGTSQQKFTMTFAGDSRRGPAQVTLRVVDAGDDKIVYGNAAVAYTVEPPPRTWFWVGVSAGAVAVFALLVWFVVFLRRWAAERNVRPLAIVLYRDGRQAQVLDAPDRRARQFRFAVRDESGLHRLDLAAPGEYAYSLERRSGIYLLRPPDLPAVELVAGQRFDLPGGADQIGINDEGRRPAPGRPAPRPRSAAEPNDLGGSNDDDSLVW